MNPLRWSYTRALQVMLGGMALAAIGSYTVQPLLYAGIAVAMLGGFRNSR